MSGVAGGIATVVRVKYFVFWGFKQNLIPYMWQKVLANVLTEGGIVDSYVC